MVYAPHRYRPSIPIAESCSCGGAYILIPCSHWHCYNCGKDSRDRWEGVEEIEHICDFHKKNPDNEDFNCDCYIEYTEGKKIRE